MKNRLIKIVVRELVIVMTMGLIVLGVNLIPTKKMVSGESEGSTFFKRLAETTTTVTEFSPNFRNLNRIDVLFKNPNLESRDQLEIVLKDENGTVVASQEFSGFNLGDTSYARMDFYPINQNNLILEIKPKKIIDGKLSFGFTNEKIIFNQYFKAGINLKEAMVNTGKLLADNIAIVGLPMFLGILW